jgi:pimeloyl-ACP methyl ester carboxylesterase
MLTMLERKSTTSPLDPVGQIKASAYATRFLARGKGDNLTAEDLAYWIVDPQINGRYIDAFKRSSISSLMNYYKANYSISQFVLNLFDPEMKKITGAMIKCPTLHVHGSEETHALVSTMELEKAWMENPEKLTAKIIPGVGHFIQKEVPEELNGMISGWLDGTL